jgi:hypothetical protein
MSNQDISVFTMNFWEHFNFQNSFLSYLLQNAFGQFRVAESEENADVVFTSVFMRSAPKFKDKTVWVIWENVRPSFDLANYSISSDFDDYGGRNVRCPLWYAQLKWPGYNPPIGTGNADNHEYEAPISLESTLVERNVSPREKFCCLVARNPERHRMLAVELLSRFGQVDVYGNAAKLPLRQSKYTVLPCYTFNLCFENSMFPGYYTEKVLHAWAAGCVPLYFADRFYSEDFNPAAIINRADFATASNFVEKVGRIYNSRDAVQEITRQPLLLKRPSLERVVTFLQEAVTKIRRETRLQFPINLPRANLSRKRAVLLRVGQKIIATADSLKRKFQSENAER